MYQWYYIRLFMEERKIWTKNGLIFGITGLRCNMLAYSSERSVRNILYFRHNWPWGTENLRDSQIREIIHSRLCDLKLSMALYVCLVPMSPYSRAGISEYNLSSLEPSQCGCSPALCQASAPSKVLCMKIGPATLRVGGLLLQPPEVGSICY